MKRSIVEKIVFGILGVCVVLMILAVFFYQFMSFMMTTGYIYDKLSL